MISSIETFMREMPVLAAITKALLVVVVTVIVIKLTRVFVKKIFEGRFGLNDRSDRMPTLQGLVNSVLFYVISFIAIVMVLGIFGVNVASILAAAGVLGIAIGFGAQTLVKDIITGFFIIFENQFAVGEYVSINNQDGIVEEIGLRITKIKLFDGSLYIVPNGSITEVVNFCRDNIRVQIDVAIAHENDLEKAQRVLTEMLDKYYGEHREIITTKPTVTGVQQLNENAVTLRIIGFTLPMRQWEVERDILLLVKETLDKEQIKIPVAVREVYNYHIDEEGKP